MTGSLVITDVIALAKASRFLGCVVTDSVIFTAPVAICTAEDK